MNLARIIFKNWQTLCGVIIGAAFVIWIQRQFGWLEVLQSWRQLSFVGFASALLLMLTTYVLRAVRVFDYFRGEMRGQFATCLRLTVLHNFFNNLLPARSGELAFPVLMRDYFGVPVEKSLASLLWMRFLDLHFLCVVAGFVLLFGLNFSMFLSPVLVIFAFLPLIFFALQQKIKSRLIDKSGFVFNKLRKIIEGLPSSFNVFLRAWFWTVLNWLMKLLIFAWLLMNFAETSYSTAVLSSLSGELSSVLPVHGFAGIGTYEAAVLAGLLSSGADLKAATQAAVNLHLFTLTTSFVSALIALFLPIKHYSKIANESLKDSSQIQKV